MKVDAMSNFKNLVMTPTQNGSSSQSLTGCMYQVVQSTGAEGKNVLQLIPILNTKDNQVPVVSPPALTNTPMLNVQQPVRFSLPSAVSNMALPCPVNAQLVQQIGSANYIITTQKNPADASKTIRVDGKLSAHPNTAVLLEKPALNLPPNSQTGAPSFIIMNAKPGSVPVKTIPIFPPGHGLQIPAHAEVKSISASSLPFSIHQRIVPPNTSSDTTKIPSVIYVSPVNTVKAPTTLPQSPLLSPVLVPASQSGTTPSKGPLKWVVQENTESIVPVKTNTDTASKIVTYMARAKPEELNLPSPDVTKIKDNALVMCNNKIYFLSKSTGELKSTVHVKQETPEKNQLDAEKGKDLSKLIEVVLSKNNLPSPNAKPTQNSASSPIVHPDAVSPAKPKTSAPAQASKKEPEVIYIDDDDDDDEEIAANIQKPQDIRQSKETSCAKVCANVYTPSASQISQSSDNQVKEKEVEVVKVTKAPVFRVDDKTLRAKFGLFKQEKIILNRLPLLRPASRTPSTSQNRDRLASSENPERRKSPFLETSSISKRRRSEDAYDFSMTFDTGGNNCRSFSTTTTALPAGTADVMHTTSREGTALTETNAAYMNVSASHCAQDSAPDMYTEPSGSHSFYVSQDIAGHFSEAPPPPPPRQRFHFESVYPDETTKDEKIQRLKEVLKEREQALEALRRQKWS